MRRLFWDMDGATLVNDPIHRLRDARRLKIWGSFSALEVGEC